MLRSGPWFRADQEDCLAGRLEGDGGRLGVVLQKSDTTDGRRRQDRAAPAGRLALVVEADVARNDRIVEHLARRAHAFEAANDLSHDLRPLRVREVEAIGYCQGL